ncbi:MAG: peptide-modifying radical SAM enzyme CbpB, partial [Candidatus Humimicrobiaceae bacterium]
MNKKSRASSTGKYLNTGNGLCLNYIDLGHSDYVAVVEPDTAFWSLVTKDQLGEVVSGNRIVDKLKIHLKDI